MGFLSGVLSNIYSHLGQHKGQITDAIETLNTNKHAGKKGFNDAIERVVAGVRGYNDNVKASNEAVKIPIETLLSKLGTTLTDKLNVITPHDVSGQNTFSQQDIDKANRAAVETYKLLREYKEYAATFIRDLDIEKLDVKNAVNDLNSNLSRKVMYAIGSVKHETERLGQLAEKESLALEETKKKISDTLSTLTTGVDCKIDAQVRVFVRNIKDRVNVTLEGINAINKQLTSHVNDLYEWIVEAEKVLDAALENVQIILNELDGDASRQPKRVEEAVEHIAMAAKVLYDAAAEARKKVVDLIPAALKVVMKLDDAIKGDLYGIRKTIETQVEKITAAIGELGNNFPDIGESNRNIRGIFDHIKGTVVEIQGNARNSTGLWGIVKGIKAYASGFGDSRVFYTAVCGWVDDTLGSDGNRGTENKQGYLEAYVKHCVGFYIKDIENKHKFKSNKSTEGEIVKEIRAAMKKALSTEADAAVAAFKREVATELKSTQEIEKYVKAAKSSCDTFATHLGAEIDAIVAKVIRTIEEAVVLDRERPTKISDLCLPVHVTVVALQSKARQIAYEFESLLLQARLGVGNTTTSVSKELDKVHGRCMTLEHELKRALGQNGGSKNPTLVHAVEKAIEQVTETLKQQLPTDIAHPRTADLSKQNHGFTKYTDYVKQPVSWTNYPTEGHLPEAINKILQQVTSTLADIENFNDQAIVKFGEFGNSFANLFYKIKNAAGGGEGVKGRLNELKEKYFLKADDYSKNAKESIRKIHCDLSTLQRSLADGPINKINGLLAFLTKAETDVAKALKEEVHRDIKNAETKLTTFACKQYVNLLKFALQKFADKVTTELQPLPSDISADLEHGHKKFMNIFADAFLAKTKEIDAIDITSSKKERYPLSKAADICKDAVKRFLTKLQNHNDFTSDVAKVSPSTNALRTLFSKLHHAKHFNNEFSGNLESLANELRGLNPKAYGEGNNPWLFESLKKGLALLVEEFGKTYISTYSQQTIEWEQATADEKLKYAKVLFTMTPFIYHELTELKEGLEKRNEKWNLYGIYNSSDPPSSLHALFFRENGYDADLPDDAAYGALNHRGTLKGSTIHRYLTADKHQLFKRTATDLSSSGDDGGLTVELEEENGVIRRLYDCLHTYSRVCHLIIHPKSRPPCSVYEILVWCCGLQFNPVYETLKAQVKSEFMKDDKLHPGTKKLQPFDAHPSPVKYGDVEAELYKVSSDSHAVLTAILGHGHKDGIYACEFSSNSLKFDYPSNMIQLLRTLFDLLKRLYHQLYFLLQQCKHNAQLSGWRDCHYGRYIGGSGWQCNTKQCPKQDCDQRHGQSGNQTGGQYPSCGVKSPLQSFLEDGLKGHLPHSVAARGSSLSCGTCGSTPGMPCRTPMGFADISAIASHTMIGRDICEVLYDFCGRPNSPLTRLCGYLNCLMPSAPKTLADMFSFYHHLTDRWGMHGQEHKQKPFTEKVNAANFGRTYDELNVYHLFSPSHSAAWKGHAAGSLASLVCLSTDSVVCGPYLRPIGHAICETFSSKHADKYLSWIVYLTASFYDLLKKLYDECNSKCGSRGSNCHVKACVKECPTTTIKQDPPRYHDRNCKSIVRCNSTLPTLAKYGFVLGDPERLSGSAGIEKKRTCRDLCTVFAEAFEENSHLVQFFKAIDNFMFTIRAPFIWLNVALWLLSLLYLICVMVGRLDVLHIRSHLRTPSSHKITAQSLLAAAQVGRLAKISYLQP